MRGRVNVLFPFLKCTLHRNRVLAGLHRQRLERKVFIFLLKIQKIYLFFGFKMRKYKFYYNKPLKLQRGQTRVL